MVKLIERKQLKNETDNPLIYCSKTMINFIFIEMGIGILHIHLEVSMDRMVNN